MNRYPVPPGSIRGELIVRVRRGRKYGSLTIDTDGCSCHTGQADTPAPWFWNLDRTAVVRLLHLVGFAHQAGAGDPPCLWFDWCPDHAPIRHRGGHVTSLGIHLQGVPLDQLDAAVVLCKAIVRESFPWIETSDSATQAAAAIWPPEWLANLKPERI